MLLSLFKLVLEKCLKVQGNLWILSLARCMNTGSLISVTTMPYAMFPPQVSASPEVARLWVIFIHLKLWIAVARHNFKWVKITRNRATSREAEPCGEKMVYRPCHMHVLYVNCEKMFWRGITPKILIFRYLQNMRKFIDNRIQRGPIGGHFYLAPFVISETFHSGFIILYQIKCLIHTRITWWQNITSNMADWRPFV